MSDSGRDRRPFAAYETSELRQFQMDIAERLEERGERADSLAPVAGAPEPPVLSIPVWKCNACGCLWRDNLDETLSLLDAEQKSCPTCEHSTPVDACSIHWLHMVAAPSRVAPPSPEPPSKSVGWVNSAGPLSVAPHSGAQTVKCSCGGVMFGDGGSHAATCSAYEAPLPRATEPEAGAAQPSVPPPAIEAVIAEMRTIQMVAGQCGAENTSAGLMADAESLRCRRWSDALEAVLRPPREEPSATTFPLTRQQAEYVVRVATERDMPDHACRRCVPDAMSDTFVCLRHLLTDWLATHGRGEETKA